MMLHITARLSEAFSVQDPWEKKKKKMNVTHEKKKKLSTTLRRNISGDARSMLTCLVPMHIHGMKFCSVYHSRSVY